MFHFINSLKHEVPAEEKREKVNRIILQSTGQTKNLLQEMLIQRYYIEGYWDYKIAQPYPEKVGKEWKIQPLTTLEYVDFLLENHYCNGKVVASFMEVLRNHADTLELQKLQEKAMQKKVAIEYKSYANLKNKGVLFSDPYLMVEDYPPIRDICYRLRYKNLTYEQAEKDYPLLQQVYNGKPTVDHLSIIRRFAPNRHVTKNKSPPTTRDALSKPSSSGGPFIIWLPKRRTALRFWKT